ncbi:MAG: branched-chain amino acid ABC transporter permease [Actinobacteria bacterium]|nr:branched-chain amino acid ABC transporter permease [Actinomycetota bacterium]
MGRAKPSSKATDDWSGIIGPALGLGFAVFAFGLSFGVLCIDAGGTVPKAMAMSLFVFTGASQFSAVGVIAAGGSAISAAAGALILASRNAVYGVAVAPSLRGSVPYRLFASQFTIDETTGMTLAQDTPARSRRAYWVTAASIYVFWNLATLIGAVAGSNIDTERYGLDVAFAAAFVGMLAPLVRSSRARRVASAGAVVCIATTPFVPIGVGIIIAALAALVGLCRGTEPTTAGSTGGRA